MVTLRVVSDGSGKEKKVKNSIHGPDFGLNEGEGNPSCLVAHYHNCKPISDHQSAPPIVHIHSHHLHLSRSFMYYDDQTWWNVSYQSAMTMELGGILETRRAGWEGWVGCSINVLK